MLAGSSYREHRTAEGDRLTLSYRGALHTPICLSDGFNDIAGRWAFDAIAEGILEAPDVERARSAISLALEVDALDVADPTTHATANFFEGCKLVVQFVEMQRSTRGIEAGFQRAVPAFSSLAGTSDYANAQVHRWIDAMRGYLNAAGESDAVSMLEETERRLPPVPAHLFAPAIPGTEIAAQIHEIGDQGMDGDSKAAAARARELLRKARATLSETDTHRLDIALLYLTMATVSRADPFEMRAVAADAMQDAAVIRKTAPSAAAGFELEAASQMTSVDGNEALQRRSSRALEDARAIYGDHDPCMAKFFFEASAGAYALHRLDEGDRLFDAGAALLAPSRRCAQGGELDTPLLVISLSDAGTRMNVAEASPERIAKVIALGHGLEDDAILKTGAILPSAQMSFDGIIPIGLAARQGDKDALDRALKAYLKVLKDNPQLRWLSGNLLFEPRTDRSLHGARIALPARRHAMPRQLTLRKYALAALAGLALAACACRTAADDLPANPEDALNLANDDRTAGRMAEAVRIDLAVIDRMGAREPDPLARTYRGLAALQLAQIYMTESKPKDAEMAALQALKEADGSTDYLRIAPAAADELERALAMQSRASEALSPLLAVEAELKRRESRPAATLPSTGSTMRFPGRAEVFRPSRRHRQARSPCGRWVARYACSR